MGLFRKSMLDYVSDGFENVVRYDRQGNPSVFVKFPKMKSSDLDARLPNHTHPAFIVNGIEQDYILLGKYMGSAVTESGAVCSIPNMPPVELDYSNALQKCRMMPGCTGMTQADYGFLLLLAQKMGWEPKGNIMYGDSGGKHYRSATTYYAGYEADYRGWRYECIAQCTGKAPSEHPEYWLRKRQIGGVDANGTETGEMHETLTGSGPKEWYLNGKTDSISDITGNMHEWHYGYRVVGGELQILENNNAADPYSVLDDTGAWKAILPNPGDTGHTLVAPGTQGTLRWYFGSDGLCLSTRAPLNAYGTSFFRYLRTYELAYVPDIVRELGIFPTVGSQMKGRISITSGDAPKYIYGGGFYGAGNENTYGLGDAMQSTGMQAYAVRPRATYW